MKLARLAAILGVAVTAVLVAPHPASAAASIPGTPMGLRNVRSAQNAAQTLVYWKPVAGATNYRVTVTDGVTSWSYVVAATQPLNAGGTHQLTVATPDKCSRYQITVASRDAEGQGSSISVTEKSLVPTMVIKAKAVRGTDRTKATFTYTAPQWKGYLGGPTGGAQPDDPRNPKMSFTSTAQLVRLSDNKVVATNAATGASWTRARSLNFSGLEPNRAYVLKITNANKWGSCAAQTGRILLKAN
ncbi:hypothetical protein [Couchioplanes azureus]|uniref:hypothetical protein n=1 Tax=Couchioplanes caeruleus TaxID=56438 RepID=UPI001671167A|nr:hypothetical protein [Couchioplanes caeruleus]GGQ61294.1 hypothetical protein GCM10010166_33750 [Couchioplanes caeruleus subsp. azureus]